MALALLSSCDKCIEKSLGMAGDNRDELETVLDYFRYDADPLRYKAARFLIANMPQQYHFSGSAVDYFNSVYVKAGNESQNERTGFMNSSLAGYDLARNSVEYDVFADQCPIWRTVYIERPYVKLGRKNIYL